MIVIDDAEALNAAVQALRSLRLPPQLERAQLLLAAGAEPRVPNWPARVGAIVDWSAIERILATDLPEREMRAAVIECVSIEFDKASLNAEVDETLLALVDLECRDLRSVRAKAMKIETSLRRYEAGSWPRCKDSVVLGADEPPRHALMHRLLRYDQIFNIRVPKKKSAISERIGDFSTLCDRDKKMVAVANRATVVALMGTDGGKKGSNVASTDSSIAVATNGALQVAEKNFRDAHLTFKALEGERKSIVAAINVMTLKESEFDRVPEYRELGVNYLAAHYPNYPAIQPNLKKVFDALEDLDEKRFVAGQTLGQARRVVEEERKTEARRRLGEMCPRRQASARKIDAVFNTLLSLLDEEAQLNREAMSAVACAPGYWSGSSDTAATDGKLKEAIYKWRSARRAVGWL